MSAHSDPVIRADVVRVPGPEPASNRLASLPVVLRVPRYVVSRPAPPVALRRTGHDRPWDRAAALVIVVAACGMILWWQTWAGRSAVRPAPVHRQAAAEVQTLPPLAPKAAAAGRGATPPATGQREAGSRLPRASVRLVLPSRPKEGSRD